MKSLSRVQLLATSWTAAYQAPPSMRFSRQEYWSGVPLPSPGLLYLHTNFRISLSISPKKKICLDCNRDCIGSIHQYGNNGFFKQYWAFQFMKNIYISFQVFFQFSSVTQSCPTLCDPMNHSTPGLPVYHQLSEFTQTHVHRVGDDIQPSHPLSSPSPPTPNPTQHQGLFQWVNSSHEVAKVLEFQPQHQSFQWTPRTDLP